MKSCNSIERIYLYEALPHTQAQGCTTVISKEVAHQFVHSKLPWIHDHLVDVIAAWTGDFLFYKKPLLQYRLHGANTVGMSLAERRTRPFPQKIRMFLSMLIRYPEKTGEACRKEIFQPSDSAIDLLKSELGEPIDSDEFEKWRALEKKKLQYIEERKLFSYLVLKMKNRDYFQCDTPFCTFDYHLVNLFNELGAMFKKK